MWKKLLERINQIKTMVTSDHIGAYAAQAAFFFVLSLIPMLLLLITLVQVTPMTKAEVMESVVQAFPTPAESMLRSLVNQVYNRSSGIVPLTALMVLWLAGRGVLSMTSGLNNIYGNFETRNYILLRVRATFYTVLFIVILILSMLLSVFGNSLKNVIREQIPELVELTQSIIQVRSVVSLPLLLLFSLIIYKFLPNHKTTLKKELPGAIFASIAWLICSHIFSIYLDVFQGFSDMYGSLTTLVLLMLWIYFCMYVMLLGGKLNVVLMKNEKLVDNNLKV